MLAGRKKGKTIGKKDKGKRCRGD